ncbi:MAG: GTPase [Candidatus Micrarchaeales archaeon]
MADKQALQQKLEELQKDYSKTKYNKATNKYLSLLRAKMAKVRRAMAEKKGKKGEGFGVRKSGDATIVLVGFPNAGKSSLLNKLTGTDSKVASYAFTTLSVIPGMLQYNGAKIQMLDIPGLIEGAHLGKGSGTQVASVIRIADLLIFVVDATEPDQLPTLVEELSLLDIKVNREKPRVMIEEKGSGGIIVESNGHKIPEKGEVTAILNETGVYNGKAIFYSNMDAEELIALLVEKAVYVNGIVALNKMDLLDRSKAEQIRRDMQSKFKMQVVAVSATRETNLEELKETLFDKLGLIRIYLNPKEGNVDFSKPFVTKEGSTILDVAKGLHSKAAKNLRFAYVTGSSAKFSNQKVGGDHVVNDGDVVTLVYERF